MGNRIIGLILIAFLPIMAFTQKDATLDSLQHILKSNIHDTTRLNTLVNIAHAYLLARQPGNAEHAIKEGFDLADEKNLNIPYGLIWAKAHLHFNKREILDGLSEMEKVFELLKPSEKKKEYAEAKNFYAQLYLYAGKFNKSIEIYQENIDFAVTNKIYEVLPGAYSGLAYVYLNLNNTEEQRKNLMLMADVAQKIDADRTTANAYLRLGDIGMSNDSNFSYAIEQYQKCLEFEKKLTDSAGISFTLLRIGWNYYLKKELDTALDYFFYSLEYSIPINRLTSITNAYGNIGTIYRDKKDYSKAIDYYKKSIEYSYKAKDYYNLSWLYNDMSVMDTAQGNFKQAYLNHVLHKKFSDSLGMERYNQGLADARTRYESENAEKELEIVTIKLKQHKYFTYAFGGLILLAIVMGLLIFRQIKLRNRQRISEMNHKISEVTQRNLRQQMNPHFIFNTLNSIQYYMYQHDKIATNNYLTKFSSLMRQTLENSQHTSIPIKDELDALELYLELESFRFKEKFEYKIEVDEDIDIMLLKIPTMLIQPYVENSISHGLVNKEEKGWVNIDLKLSENHLVCTIEDNGIGREAAMGLKNGRQDSHNSLGTKITESRLNLVNSLYGKSMKIEYNDLKDKDGNAQGTRVVIHIPIIS
ncbi:MAG: histidine kinase [Bacteroidales bacterium]|nr:histidine kinase [Bacteroidales bacterium]MCF8404791.1 histidine kinase [Bacteroidales bacterium]